METENEEVFASHLENLERFASGLFIQDLNIRVAIFLETDNSKKALVEGHFGRKVLLDCAHQIDIIDLAQLHQVYMPHNEESIENVLLRLYAFQTHVSHVLHLISL